MKIWDVIVLTEDRYLNPKELTPYKQQVIDEDNYVLTALLEIGLKVHRLSWSDPDFDWSTTRLVLIRTTWDYFHRFDEFQDWLKAAEQKTALVNSPKLIHWNIDKHYLRDLQSKGINIPPTRFIESKTQTTLAEVFIECHWKETVLKPCIAGTARHTYRVNRQNVNNHESIFQELIRNEAMMLQEFQEHILTKGEVSMMVFNGNFTHAVIKQAKAGDFRVQDDFGGKVTGYSPTQKEINFAEHVMSQCPEVPLYGRVDVMWDNNNEPCVAELEIIEPELWFRFNPKAAEQLAQSIANLLTKQEHETRTH